MAERPTRVEYPLPPRNHVMGEEALATFRSRIERGDTVSNADARALLNEIDAERYETITAIWERDALLAGVWQPIETAPKDKRLLAVVEGKVRIVMWTKASHIGWWGFCLVDQGAEDCEICEPTKWMPMPDPEETTHAR